MNGYIEDRDELCRDIAYALWRAPAKNLRREKLIPEDRESIARAMADHLKLANWQIRRGPPVRMATTDLQTLD